MPALLVYSRHSPSTRVLLRAASALGWSAQRLGASVPPGFAAPQDGVAIFATPPHAYQLAEQISRALLSCPVGWEAALPETYLKRRLESCLLGEVKLEADQRRFVKPALSKSFEPALFAQGELEALEVSGAAQVLVAEPVHFDCEVRLFVARGEVRASSFYRVHHQALTRRTPVPPSAHREALSLAESLLSDPRVPQPPAFVLDLGLIAGRGWAVVEANEAWAAGLYGCDPLDVLPVLLEACVPLGTPSCEWNQADSFRAPRGE